MATKKNRTFENKVHALIVSNSVFSGEVAALPEPAAFKRFSIEKA